MAFTKLKALAVTLILSMCIGIVAPTSVHASANEVQQYFVLLVTKDNAPIRSGNTNKSEILSRASYGTLLYAVKETTNSASNIWYLLHDGSFIFSGNCEVTGQIAPLPGAVAHECYAAIKSVLGSTYCATADHCHYRTDTYQWLCHCGTLVKTGYDVVVEACDYKMSLTKGVCDKCHNKESSVAVVANTVADTTGSLVSTLGNELSNPKATVEKTGQALLLGDASEEQTVANAMLETGMSIFGIDTPLDIRDLVVSTKNFSQNAEEEGTLKALGKIGFSVLCILPVIGTVKGIKSIDKATDAIKAADKVDGITDAAKTMIKSVETAVDTGTTATKTVDTTATIAKAADTTSVSKAANTASATFNTAEATTKTADNAKIATNSKYWTEATVYNGKKVYQRNDLFDPNQMSTWERNGETITGTNIERMAAGNAPIGYDGKSIEIHHLTQRDNSSLVELSSTFHKKNSSTIHINAGTNLPSGISRSQFDSWRESYWKNRALDFMNN